MQLRLCSRDYTWWVKGHTLLDNGGYHEGVTIVPCVPLHLTDQYDWWQFHCAICVFLNLKRYFPKRCVTYSRKFMAISFTWRILNHSRFSKFPGYSLVIIPSLVPFGQCHSFRSNPVPPNFLSITDTDCVEENADAAQKDPFKFLFFFLTFFLLKPPSRIMNVNHKRHKHPLIEKDNIRQKSNIFRLTLQRSTSVLNKYSLNVWPWMFRCRLHLFSSKGMATCTPRVWGWF